MAQLRFQDPGKPMDSTAFMAQTAQFTTVEKLTDLAKAEQDLLSAQLRFNASNLVGRTVAYTAADNKTVTGVVTAASFTGTAPTLKVGDKDVALSDVTEVRDATATATASATTTTTTKSPST